MELSGGITVELAGTEVGIEPVWDGYGALTGIDVTVEVKGSVIEAPPGSDLDSEDSWEALGSELAELARGWVESVLGRSLELNADFLGLGRNIESAHPLKFASMPTEWEEAFPELEIRVSGSGRILNMREYADSPFEEVSA